MSVLRSDADAAYVTICSPKVAYTNRYGFEEGMRRAREEYERRAAAATERGLRYLWSFFHPDARALEEIASLVESGSIRPIIDKVFTLTDLAAAHEHCETKRTRGKIVIDIKH